MDILGIGVPELVFILLIALIVLGPKDMQKTGKTVGRWLNSVVRSQTWRDVKNVSRKISTLPNELMREANLEDLEGEFQSYRQQKSKVIPPPNDQYGAWGESSATPAEKENSIAPPADEKPAPATEAGAQPETETANINPEEHDNA